MKEHAKTITLDASIEIEAANKDKRTLPSFQMVAYSGGKMELGLGFPVVVELAGLEIGDQKRPVRFNHSEDAGVGHTTSIRVDRGRLLASGVVSRDTDAAKEVVSASKKGFPWQASIGASIVESEFVEEGVSVKANGRTFKGPLILVTESVLGEISFVDLGADMTTSVKVAAKKQGQEIEMAKNKADNTVDPVAAERTRVQEINEIQAGYNDDTSIKARDTAIANGDTVDSFRTTMLANLRASRTTVPAEVEGTVGVTEGDTLKCAALLVSGQQAVAEKAFKPEVIEAARGLGINTAMDLVKMSVKMRHGTVPQGVDSQIKASFSTMDLSTALGGGADLVAAQTFHDTPSTWRSWCKRESVNSLRQHTAVRAFLSNGGYETVAPDGEIKHASGEEETTTHQAKTRGKMFSVDRQHLINDDLGLIMSYIAELGREGARSISDLVYDTLIANAGAHFHADNSNLETGGGSALALAGLTAAILSFRARVDAAERPLDLAPAVMVVAPALEATARTLLQSQELSRDTSATGGDEGTSNPWHKVMTLEVEPRLSTANGGVDATWYIFSNPAQLACLSCSFLHGVETPTIETSQADFSTLGLQMRGYHDFGADLTDARAGLKSAGS